MSSRICLICVALCVSSLLTAACAPLKDVRDYAASSAKLSSYKNLTVRFRDTYERERPFLGSNRQCNLADEQRRDKKRKTLYPDLIKIHDRMAEYMAILAALAGDKAFDLSGSVSQLGDAIKQHPDFGIEAAQVDAYVQLGQVVTNLVTKGIQQKAIRDTVTEANPHVKDLLDGMDIVLIAYRIDNNRERECVVEFLHQESTYAARNRRTALLGIIGLEMAQQKAEEYSLATDAINQARTGIDAMRNGHSELKANVNNLSSKELAATLQDLSGEIEKARKAIEKLD